MSRTTARRPTIGRVRVGLLALVATFAVGVRDASVGSGTRPAGATVWQTGKPVPIASKAGHARFTVPTSSAGSRTLVVVSSLARSAGTFPIKLAAKAVDPARVEPPETEPE